MNILQNISLRKYSTMRLGGNAKYLVEIFNIEDLKQAWMWAKENKTPMIVVGHGSNIIWKDEGFEGLVMVCKLPGYTLQKFDENNAAITVGAGENWDGVVKRSVDEGYYTLAPLSLIPGTAGATPVQNVGAYGQEISKCLMTLQVFNLESGELSTLRASDCNFGYRTSRFKTTDKNKYLITSITLTISKEPLLKPYYESLQNYLDKYDINVKSPIDIRTAVVNIRSEKLPDPHNIANNGSFFANPIISEETLVQIKDSYENIKYWNVGDNKVKISAAWLVENAGFKDVHDAETGMSTWHKQPLVLVNEHAKNTEDLITFRDKIISTVKEKFDITLQQEPELLP